MLHGAVFDQDGLIFDTEVQFIRAWNMAAERMGFVMPKGFHAAVTGSNGEALTRTVHAWLPEIDAQAYIDLTYAISYDLQEKELVKKPGLRVILGLFQEHGVRMAVASSSHRRRVVSNLERAGLLPFFEDVICREDLTRCKPDPEAFLTAAARLGLAPSDCYVFEDSFNGVRAGHAAGCRTIMIPDLYAPDEEIARCYDACFPDLGAAAAAIREGLL